MLKEIKKKKIHNHTSRLEMHKSNTALISTTSIHIPFHTQNLIQIPKIHLSKHMHDCLVFQWFWKILCDVWKLTLFFILNRVQVATCTKLNKYCIYSKIFIFISFTFLLLFFLFSVYNTSSSIFCVYILYKMVFVDVFGRKILTPQF